MLLKNIIPYFNLFSLLLIIVYSYIVIFFLFVVDVRKKFLLFVINFFLISFVGLYYKLDGLIMLFIISELTVIFVFIVLFSQLYSFNNYSSFKSKYYYSLFLVVLLLTISDYSLNIIHYKNFYSFYNIILNDFYYIYYSYFEKQILLTVLILFVITFYSIFFILLFYTIKTLTFTQQKKKKNIYLLRKQNLIHQNNYNAKIRIFKNKN